MRALLPTSLNGYLLLGISVITVPLLAAILHATIEMRRLTAFSQRLVLESVQTTRVLQNMFEERSALERAARLYQVLGGAKLLTVFYEHDSALSATLVELRGLLRSESARNALEPFATLQQRIVTQMRATPSPAAVPDFGALDDRATGIATYVKSQIDTELGSLQDQTDSARRELFWESSMLIPLALAATLSFAFGIGRPIRQVDRAITELGGGNFAREITVSGPVDLQRLGQQLEWLRGRLLDLAEERNRFLRHMSHELKDRKSVV